jgi:polyisoprenoid-binding protein YceI
MKTTFLKQAIAVVTAVTFSVAALNAGEPTGPVKYKINSGTSTAEWNGKKVTGEHSGNIKIESGVLEVKDNLIKSGTISIDMASMVCTDMQGEYADKLINHLKSDDFFSVEKYKTATLKIKEVKSMKYEKEGQPNYTLTGDLTIKGITHPVSFPAYITFKDNNMAAIGEMVIDRSKYEVKYGSTSFFDNLGDKAIHNDFTIKFKLAAENK